MRNLEVTLSWIHDPRDPYTLRDATLVVPNWGRSGNLVDWRHGRMVGTVVLSSIQTRRK